MAKLLDLSVKTVETHMGLALKTVNEAIEQYKSGKSNYAPVYSINK